MINCILLLQNSSTIKKEEENFSPKEENTFSHSLLFLLSVKLYLHRNWLYFHPPFFSPAANVIKILQNNKSCECWLKSFICFFIIFEEAQWNYYQLSNISSLLPPSHKVPFLYNKLSWTINNDMKIGKLHTLTPQLHGNEMFIMMENWANCKNNIIQQDKSSSIIKYFLLI